MTFEEFVDNLLDVADDRHPGVEVFFRNAIVRALGPPLSRLRTDWTEAATTFTTVADAYEYDQGVAADFPVNVGDIDLLWSDPGGSEAVILRPAPLAEVRSLSYAGSATPRFYAWHHRKLLLGPPTIAGIVLRLDYTIDARRDETTGNLITATDTTTTNAWFRLGEGHDMLRCRVLADYYGSFSRNAELASVFAGFFDAARREARSQVQAKRDDGIRAPASWPNDAGAWEGNLRWRWGS